MFCDECDCCVHAEMLVCLSEGEDQVPQGMYRGNILFLSRCRVSGRLLEKAAFSLDYMISTFGRNHGSFSLNDCHVQVQKEW